MDGAYAGSAFAQMFSVVAWGSAGWAGIFVLIAPRVKASLFASPYRFPVFLYHILFAAAFGHPYAIFRLLFLIEALFGHAQALWVEIASYALLTVYFIALPVLLELLVSWAMVFSARLKKLIWIPATRQAIVLSLGLNLAAFLVGIMAGAIRLAIGFN